MSQLSHRGAAATEILACGFNPRHHGRSYDNGSTAQSSLVAALRPCFYRGHEAVHDSTLRPTHAPGIPLLLACRLRHQSGDRTQTAFDRAREPDDRTWHEQLQPDEA